MSDSEAESKGGKVLSAYLTAFGAWLEASWPLTGADLKGYAEWLQAAGSALWECSVDHSSKAGWRAVTIQSVMKKAMLWEKEPTWNGALEVFLPESVGAADGADEAGKGNPTEKPFRWAYCVGHQRGIALHAMAMHAWKSEDGNAAWVKALLSAVVVQKQQISAQKAAFKGLATSLRIQEWSTPFSYLALLELLISTNSAFARMSTSDFTKALLTEMPSAADLLDINYLCGIVHRIGHEALRTLLSFQEKENEGRDVVPLTFWRKKALLMLPSHKRRGSSAEPALNPESQRLLFDRITHESSKDGKQWGSMPDARIVVWREASIRLALVMAKLEPNVKETVLASWPSGMLDADLAANTAPERWNVVIKASAKMAAHQKQVNRSAERALAQAAAAEAEKKAALLQASASEEDHRSALWLSLEAKGARHWQDLVDATTKILSESHEALQQGSERAETGVRCLQDAFRYQGSLPSMDVPQSWRPFLQGMQSVVVADLSDLIESDLPAHATSVMPIKAAFAFLSAASDAVGILVLPSLPPALAKLQAMLGQAVLEVCQMQTAAGECLWDFRFLHLPHGQSYMVVMLILVGLSAEGSIRSRVAGSATWTNLTIPKITVARDSATGWNPAPMAGEFWTGLFGSLKIRPLEAGSVIVEVHPSTSLIGSLYPEIAAHNANSQSWERIQWLGAHCSPSPAKADKITRFLQEKAKLESSNERKRALKAAGSLTDTSLEELAMRLESVGHFPGASILPHRLEEGLYQNLLPEAGKLPLALPEMFEHRYQAPADVDASLSFGDERLPPLLQMAKQCLQAKVAMLQSARVASWGLFPAEHLKAGDILTTLQFGRAKAPNSALVELHLKVLKPESSHVTHRLVHFGTVHSLSSYLHFVTDDAGESMQRLVFLKPVFRVENGAVVADLQLPEDVSPFSKEFALRCEQVAPRKPASKAKATSQQDIPPIEDLLEPPKEPPPQCEDTTEMPLEDSEMVEKEGEDDNEDQALSKLTPKTKKFKGAAKKAHVFEGETAGSKAAKSGDVATSSPQAEPSKKRKAQTDNSLEGGEAAGPKAAKSGDVATSSPQAEPSKLRKAQTDNSLEGGEAAGSKAAKSGDVAAPSEKAQTHDIKHELEDGVQFKQTMEGGIRKVWCEEFGAGLFFPSAVELDAGSQLHTVAEISVKDDGNLCVLQPDGAGREDKAENPHELKFALKPNDYVQVNGSLLTARKFASSLDPKETIFGHKVLTIENKVKIEASAKHSIEVAPFGAGPNLQGWPVRGANATFTLPRKGLCGSWLLEKAGDQWIPTAYYWVNIKKTAYNPGFFYFSHNQSKKAVPVGSAEQKPQAEDAD